MTSNFNIWKSVKPDKGNTVTGTQEKYCILQESNQKQSE